MSFWQNSAFSKHLVLRAASDPRALAAAVRREVRAVDPSAAVEHFTTMAQIRRDSLGARTFAMRLLIGFGVVATMLSLVGVYGVLSLSVGSRLKEIAVRKAIGAQRRDIRRLILGEGSKLIVVGGDRIHSGGARSAGRFTARTARGVASSLVRYPLVR